MELRAIPLPNGLGYCLVGYHSTGTVTTKLLLGTFQTLNAAAWTGAKLDEHGGDGITYNADNHDPF